MRRTAAGAVIALSVVGLAAAITFHDGALGLGNKRRNFFPIAFEQSCDV